MKDIKYIENIIIINSEKILKNKVNQDIIDIQDKKFLKIDKKHKETKESQMNTL
jgi:hypothetical protein